MSMNVKSPSPPIIFFVKKCDPPPPSLLCQIYADPPFLGRQKVNDPPLNSSGPPPLLRNECSLRVIKKGLKKYVERILAVEKSRIVDAFAPIL